MPIKVFVCSPAYFVFLFVFASEFKLRSVFAYASEKVSFPHSSSCLITQRNSTPYIKGRAFFETSSKLQYSEKARLTYPWNLKRYFLSGKYWISTIPKTCSNQWPAKRWELHLSRKIIQNSTGIPSFTCVWRRASLLSPKVSLIKYPVFRETLATLTKTAVKFISLFFSFSRLSVFLP